MTGHALAVALLLCAATVPAQAQPVAGASVATGLTLVELERLATENNPTLRAAQANIDAARSQARQSGAWPNPVIGAVAEEIKFGDQDRRGEYGFFVDQPIILGGKLRLQRDVFERTADRAVADLELQKQRVLRSVRTLFYEALAIERRVDVNERLAALASEAVSITAQLFNVGAADRPDFLASEIEARRIQLELNAAKNSAFAIRQQLAAAVGSFEVAGRQLAGSMDDPLPELERTAATQLLVEQSPQIRAARAELARARAAVALAQRTTFPDLFIRGGSLYNREHGEDTGRPVGWEGALEVGVSVPLFNRNHGGIAAAQAEELRAHAEVQRLELSLRSQLASEFARYLTAVRDAETYRKEILPRAEEAFRLYLARYKEMGAAYPQVLVAQRGLFEFTARYFERIEDSWRAALAIQGFLSGSGLEPPGERVEVTGSETLFGRRGDRQ
jgi:cobalt-zinc-cadmium efflux system outer membrane protein